MEAIEGFRISGRGDGVFSTVVTTPTSVSSVYDMPDQVISEGGKPVSYSGSDPKAIAQRLEAAISGSAFIPFERVGEHTRLVLSSLGQTDGNTTRGGLEDLYLVMRGELKIGSLLRPHLSLIDLGRATWTYGNELHTIGTNVSDLYLPTVAAFESSEAAKALTGGLCDVQTLPKSGYARSGAGRQAMLSLFDKGPAIGLLRVLARSGSTGNTSVCGTHLRWR